MFKFIKKILGIKKKKVGILEKLENDHKMILKEFKIIMDEFDKMKISKLKEKLENFYDILISHFLLEEKTIYIDRLRKIKEKSIDLNKEYEIISNLKEKIKKIRNNLNSLEEKDRENIKKELNQLGFMLVERINYEETKVYPLIKEKLLNE